MADPDLLASCRMAILGLGLMGGSLAMALRGRCAALLGIDPDPAVLALARQRQVADQLSSDAAALLPQVDVIILAAPVRAILNLIRELPGLHPGSPVVLDLGSTKVEICRAYEGLPARFDPLGGHPMCGKESSSLANADPRLYQGAPFAFTPLSRTSSRAQALAVQLAQAVGARPVWLEPLLHDRWVAATSHLPFLIANALASATPGEAAPLVGPGFRSSARLAATPTRMMLDVLDTNRDNILESMKRFREQLSLIEESLSRGDLDSLRQILDQGAEGQRTLVQRSGQGE